MRVALVVFFAFVIAPYTEAALLVPPAEIVGMHLVPTNPSPGEQVVATVRSTGNPSTLSYEWSVDGRVVAQGSDARSITVEAGAVGSQTVITVRLVGTAGETRGSATKVIRPAEVDIVWEGQTYVPPFYEGRPLVNGSSSFTAIAVPRVVENGRDVPEGELSYAWSINGQSLSDQSGYGKSSIEAVPPFFDTPFTVSVVVTTRSGATVAENEVTITPTPPVMLIYQNLPLSGIDFNRAQTEAVSFSENELSFKAYPFFVENPDELSYAWEINGVSVTDSASPRSLTVRKTSGESGTYIIKVSFKHVRKIFEKGLASFNLSL